MLDKTLDITISTSTVAWYGAIVATVSAFIAISNYFRDRARIKIKYRKNVKVTAGPGPYDPSKIYFNIIVTNKGRRPVNIAKVAIRNIGVDKKGKYSLLSDSFLVGRSRVLDEKNPTTDYFAEQDLINIENAWYIEVYDATGHRYRKYLKLIPPFWKRKS